MYSLVSFIGVPLGIYFTALGGDVKGHGGGGDVLGGIKGRGFFDRRYMREHEGDGKKGG